MRLTQQDTYCDNMPTDSNSTSNSTNNQNNNQTNSTATGSGGQVVIGCDSNDGSDSACQETVKQILEQGGYQCEKLAIDPNAYATYSYSDNAKGKKGVYLMAASLISYLDAGKANFDFNVMGIRGDITPWGKKDGFESKGVPKDHHGDCTIPECDTWQGKTYPELNQNYMPNKVVATYGETHEELGRNILAALGGQGPGGGSSEGTGAAIKDKTFEACIRRICAATDSIFIVENNAAILFPYTDWMAFTLHEKINTISAKEIDPDIHSFQYNNEGTYNKVTATWGGAKLPERFPDKNKNVQTSVTDPNNVNNTLNSLKKDSGIKTSNDLKNKINDKVVTKYNNANLSGIVSNAKASKFIHQYDEKISITQSTTTVTKNDKTTTEETNNPDGSVTLSEQYNKLVDIYGVMEKRLESAVPNKETAQYVVNALLIQYVREFNNSCHVRAINQQKYLGGTFYTVENPLTKESEVLYLHGYTMRTQKDEPLYIDLDFRYGPEGAEEILDYQHFGGGGGGGNTNASSTEEQIWADAAKCKWAQDQEDCSTNDPATAKKHYDDYTARGQEVHFDCFGMSAYLYYRFNNETNIPAHVIGSTDHKVIELYKNNQWYKPVEEYRRLDYKFHYDDATRSPNSPVLLEAPGGSKPSTTGGNTKK